MMAVNSDFKVAALVDASGLFHGFNVYKGNILSTVTVPVSVAIGVVVVPDVLNADPSVVLVKRTKA